MKTYFLSATGYGAMPSWTIGLSEGDESCGRGRKGNDDTCSDPTSSGAERAVIVKSCYLLVSFIVWCNLKSQKWGVEVKWSKDTEID
ncbi:hypothetical protein TIFTF001_056237 [Ficus carica]|uniref:Uncharacterized protein n=2 Tax=Ficus carica TaxID=3494 RepID=A0AA88EK69_FICCA|nr:hypothetical protein TIFTF001_056235 [Ficus carica]GMN75474.1 hypothetical protein TIFTF001_056237 [Ficus carica]